MLPGYFANLTVRKYSSLLAVAWEIPKKENSIPSRGKKEVKDISCSFLLAGSHTDGGIRKSKALKPMRVIVCTLLVFFSLTSARGQESKRYLKFKAKYNYTNGYILKMDSSRVEGLVKERWSGNNQYSSVIFVSKEGRKGRYYPHELWGYGNRIYSYASDGGSFYKLIQSGKKVQLYQRVSTSSWSTPGAPGMGAMHYNTESEDYYVRKIGERRFKLVKKRKFDEDFAEYFDDCERVRNSILNKESSHKDIERIVRSYNTCR